MTDKDDKEEPAEDSDEESKGSPQENSQDTPDDKSEDSPEEKPTLPKTVKIALDKSTTDSFRKLQEGLKLPVPPNLKLFENFKLDSSFQKMLQQQKENQELFKNSEVFKDMAVFQKAMKDAQSASDRYKDIFKSIDAISGQRESVLQDWAAIQRDMPNVEGLLKGSTSLDLDARARAASSAEKYLEILPASTGDDAEIAEPVDKPAGENEPREPRCLETMRMDMVALVTQTEGKPTALLQVIVSNESIPLADSGFKLGDLSDFEGSKTIDFVVSERNQEDARANSRADKLVGAFYAFLFALAVWLIKVAATSPPPVP